MKIRRCHAFLKLVILLDSVFLSSVAFSEELGSSKNSDKPNFILIFTDDQGYNDLGCFGSKNIKTPHIDRLAREGKKFTNFHVASSVCSPSRAALLTGSYPKRVGMHKGVLFPASKHGLNPKEYTIADHLKSNGYATACIGKWHLGYQVEVLPRSHGFDYYYGIPYSNDMNHPDNKGKVNPMADASWENQEEWVKKWNTPLVENEKIIEIPVNQQTITRRYTDKAIEFITENKEKPFFLYLPHSMPHIPLFVPDDVYDPNPKNAYTCVIEHIDAEVGRLIDTVRGLKLEGKTYVIFTTDNGPWLPKKHHAGSALPLRAGKGTTFEGGQRVPCVMWAPGRIEAGTSSDALVTTMDLLPTYASLCGTKLDEDLKIDGVDVSKTILGDEVSSRKEMLYYSRNGDLEGIVKGDWKLLIHKKSKKQIEMTYLFNLKDDLSEKMNLAKLYPQRVQELTAEMLKLDAEITNNMRMAWTEKSD